jgi:hypothetical protein
MSRRSKSKGLTVGQLARLLRRTCRGFEGSAGYRHSVEAAVGHFGAWSRRVKASAIGRRCCRGWAP